MNPTVVSTFSGCGGSSLGYKTAGFDVRLAVEWNDNAAATYRANFPATPLHHGDIAALTEADALARAGLEPGELDVFDGSPPCQGFSTSGHRRLEDPRNRLFVEYVRLLRAFRPRAFVFENVRGLVMGRMRLVYAEILAALEAAGYVARGALLRACYYGVPQLRERLIILGARSDLGVVPTFPPPETDPVAIGDAAPSLREHGTKWEHDPELRLGSVYRTIYGKRRLEGPSAKPRAPDLVARGRAQDAKRLNPSLPSPTIVSRSAGKGWGTVCHPTECRALSIDEMRAAFGFPADFVFVGKWTDAVERMGNSVAPPFMAAIARHVRKTILAPATP